MRMFKWLKRSSDRRSSDSHAAMLTSPDFEFDNRKNSSTRSDYSEDHLVRTEDDKRALSEFCARRSLGPNFTLNSVPNAKTPESKDSKTRKTQSESKRRVLRQARENDTSCQDVPQIQFLFSNQVFMPGSGFSLRKKKNSDKKNKKSENASESLVSTSPDLLPPRFMRQQRLDFDSDCPASPPEDFFRENSLPYTDKVDKGIDLSYETDEKLNELLDAIENIEKLQTEAHSDVANTSFGSLTRKLEQMCKFVKIPNHVYFRGIPLVKKDILHPMINTKFEDHWYRTSWMCSKVLVKENPKKWCPPGHEALDELIAKDLDILTKIRHPNILILMGLTCDESHHIQSIYEDCLGSLNNYLFKENNTLSCQTIVRYLAGIADALVYLKINNYVHTNISSHSILITTRGMAKLCNFELCSEIEDSNKKHIEKRDKNNTLDDDDCEPIYENLKNLYYSDSEIYHNIIPSDDCTAQNLSTRSLFASYRWQAPELFEVYEHNLVYPHKKTDVYSLCLTLWECCNHSMPWKNSSYEQLTDIYFSSKTGIKLPKDNRYPVCIREILFSGLPIDPDRRIDIEELAKKFNVALEILNNAEKMYITKPKPKIDIISADNIEELFKETSPIPKSEKKNSVAVNMQDAKKYSINNFDESFLNYSAVKNSNTSENNKSENILQSNKSDSTEYNSLMTPTIKRFLIGNFTSNAQSQLSFDNLSDSRSSATSEKILKLNAIISPKPYKSLEIEAPSPDQIDNIRSLTKSFEMNQNASKSLYTFDVQNISLPETPIARNTKIKRNVWLSGRDNCTSKKVTKENERENHKNPLVINNLKENINTFEVNTTKKNTEIDNIDNACSNIVNRNLRRHSLMNIKYDIASSNTINYDSSPHHSSTDNQNFGTFRSRSHSWTIPGPGQNNSEQKRIDDVTGVNIKPLVAIHEKWIMEAKQKCGRSVSLPINQRNTSLPVKPASHHVDHVATKNYVSQSSHESDGKKNTRQYKELSPLVRQSVSKKKIINNKMSDFFEKSLWQKEKAKCAFQNEPQGSSTPSHLNNNKKYESGGVDKFTNTDTYEELVKTIMKIYNLPTNTLNNPQKSNMVNQSDSDYANAKSLVMMELTNSFEKKTKVLEKMSRETCNLNKDSMLTIKADTKFEKLEKGVEVEVNCGDTSDGEDTISLPEAFTQSEEVVNKALKRCQAFSALQDAKSTEDMYIDDEFPAHVEIPTLNDEIQLMQLDSNLHEAFCEKGRDCCIIKIQEENNCDHILLYCEHNDGNKGRLSLKSDSSSNEDIKQTTRSTNLIDLSSNNSLDIKLPIIEERSGEEDNDSDSEPVLNVTRGGVQDLIMRYESEKKFSLSINKTTDTHEYDNIASAKSRDSLILDNCTIDKCKSDLDDIVYI